jgi:hypothetical protein
MNDPRITSLITMLFLIILREDYFFSLISSYFFSTYGSILIYLGSFIANEHIIAMNRANAPSI